MVNIIELQDASPKYIRRIAMLHMRAFPDFFLTQLGRSFLQTLYLGYIEDDKSGIIVAENNNRLAGFIAYSYDYSSFYKGLIKKHIIKFASCSFGAAIRHPSYVRRLMGAFKKSKEVVKPEKYVELASICVNPRINNKGVGSALIDYFKSKVDFDRYEFINLETDAEGNDSVNTFYIKNGFTLTRTYTTREGRRMNEYRYRPEEPA